MTRSQPCRSLIFRLERGTEMAAPPSWPMGMRTQSSMKMDLPARSGASGIVIPKSVLKMSCGEPFWRRAVSTVCRTESAAPETINSVFVGTMTASAGSRVMVPCFTDSDRSAATEKQTASPSFGYQREERESVMDSLYVTRRSEDREGGLVKNSLLVALAGKGSFTSGNDRPTSRVFVSSRDHFVDETSWYLRRHRISGWYICGYVLFYRKIAKALLISVTFGCIGYTKPRWRYRKRGCECVRVERWLHHHFVRPADAHRAYNSNCREGSGFGVRGSDGVMPGPAPGDRCSFLRKKRSGAADYS
jgi:hypothetical protein